MKFVEIIPYAIAHINKNFRGARVDKVAMPIRGVYRVSLYMHGVGKQTLVLSMERWARLLLPIERWNISYQADTTPFVMGLRKYLYGSVLLEALWHAEHRLALISFRVREEKVLRLVFGKGVLFLLDADGTLLQTDSQAASTAIPEEGWTSCENTASPEESVFAQAALDLAGVLFEQEQIRVRRLISKELRRRERILAKLDQDLMRFSGHEALRVEAELLKSQLYLVKRGMERVFLDDYYSAEAGSKKEVILDPRLTPAENLSRMFKQVKKFQRGLGSIEKRRGEVEAEIKRWEGYQAQLEVLDGADFGQLYKVMVTVFPPKKGKQTQRVLKKTSELLSYARVFELGGVTIYAGKSAKGNEHVTFRLAGGNDIWLHANNYPGSHVVLKRKDRSYKFSAADIRNAAVVALYYSQAKGKGKEEVVYTEAKHVRKVSGAAPGKVTLAGGKVIVVEADETLFKQVVNQKSQDT